MFRLFRRLQTAEAQPIGSRDISTLPAERHIRLVADQNGNLKRSNNDEALIETQAYRKNYVKDLRHERSIYPCLPIDDDFATDVSRAERFIAEYADDRAVATQHFPISEESELRGRYDSIVDNIFIFEHDKQYITEYMKRIGRTAVLVHELAHSTAENRYAFIVDTPDGDGIQREFTFGMRVVDVRNGVVNVMGDFFEEAFAEMSAGKYRSRTVPAFQMYSDLTFSVSTGETVRAKYTNPNSPELPDIQTFQAVSSAFAADAVDSMSAYLNCDLYSLMQRARKDETSAEAKREFIKAINSIHPDLYRKLRDVPYTKEGFIAGHQLVERAINGEDISAE